MQNNAEGTLTNNGFNFFRHTEYIINSLNK